VREALSAQIQGGQGGDVVRHRLARTASRLGHARRALEQETARLLAKTVEIYPTGHALVDVAAFSSASPDIGRRALSRILTCIGGGAYGPRREGLERLHARIAEGRLARGATLGGCLLSPARGRVLVVREPKTINDHLVVAPPGEVIWDNRFRLSLRPARSGGPGAVTVTALGERGCAELAALQPETRRSSIPARVRHGLPALRVNSRLVGVPYLWFPARAGRNSPEILCEARFWPRHSLAGAEFSVV
jgi:tRNA(Ile)-lysidine synthase